MSDQSSPPKPKPGSLRDRIAAFETKGSSSAPAGPPPPRPKPGGLQWKPRPPSPPTAPENVQSVDRKPPSTGAMSASDAMESIGRGGSLKERMAALQGKGAFGGPPPPIAPKPSVEKPKWKPPLAVPASSDADPQEGIDVGAREASRSPPPRALGSPTPESQATSNREGEAEGDGADPDPEEEGRKRRAAIAARMARLGGAKFGMAPPIFAPKPVVRKPEPAPEVKEDDQSTVVKESNQVTPPPHDLPAVADPVAEVIAETERKDELEPSPLVPPRVPASMPVPAGPRRAAPPRKKSSKSAPTTALPEPPSEEAVQSPPTSDEPRASDDRWDQEANLSTQASQELLEAAEAASHDEHLDVTADAPPAPTKAFREPVEEQEEKEELVEGAATHVEAADHEAPSEPPAEAIEAYEEEGVRRQRVAVKHAQIGAFNPLAGPPSVQPQPSLDEPALVPSKAPLVVEDEVNVDTEEYGVNIPPPVVPPRRDAVQSAQHVEADQDSAKVDANEAVAAHRDGERAVTSDAERQDGQTLPSPEPSEDPAATVEADALIASGTHRFGVDIHDKSHGDRVTDPLRSTTAQQDGSIADAETDVVPPPRAARPIPPPPVNLRSKPTPPSPPLSPPAKTPLQTLRVDEEECPPSPDIPPRPIPPPGRSGSMTENVPSPPRRSMPPPPRRSASVRVTGVLASPPPPGPASPRPVSRRPDTPPIITTLAVPEGPAPGEHDDEREEDAAENVTPRPESPGDEESARRRTIAERMARLGGLRLGGPPPMNPLSRPPLPAAPPPTSIPPDELEEETKEGEPDELEDEAARKQRIAVKLAGMGGMRLGMMPPAVPTASTRRLVARQEDSESEDAVPPVPVPAPPQRPTRKPPPPIEAPDSPERAQAGSRRTSDDGVRVEAEESDMEEVRYSDAEVRSEEESFGVQALPTPPPRMTSRSPPPIRPPIPAIPALLGRRASGASVSASSSRQASLDETPTMTGSALGRPPSEYVMVETDLDSGAADAAARAAPRRKPTRGSTRTIPALPPVPPPSAIDPPEALFGSAQWELAAIPQGNEFGEGSEMASEDSTAVHALSLSLSSSSLQPAFGKVVSSASVAGSATGSGSGRRSLDQQQQQLTTDELMAIWGKTGVRVVEAASTLFEKSKRALVGDGSHAGFVRAVLAQVPGAACPASEDEDWGYVVYAQTGAAVQRRVSDILPGDVIAFWDAKLKGHKGLHAYAQSAGSATAPLVGVVSEFDARKSKVKTWQANQHVGQQTVENVSYRLDDLKSGRVKVYRVLEA